MNGITMIIITVHRIGRTGRSGRTGIATTFINKANDESVLLDLKHLLMEAKQKVPPFLLELCSENEKYLNLGGQRNILIIFMGILFLILRRRLNCVLIALQTNVVAAIVAVLVTESQNVRNWRPSKTNRHRILGGGIIWPATRPTIKANILCILFPA